MSTNDRHHEHHGITMVTKRAIAVFTVNDVYILKFSARQQTPGNATCTVPTFTDLRSTGVGTRLYPCGIVTATP